MHLLLSSLLLVLVAGLYYLWKLVRNEQGSGAGRARLVFLVQDQEPWLEGFFRKLFRKLQNAARLEVQVVDSGSRDGTAAVLELLSRYYPLEVQSGGSVNGYAAVQTGAAVEETGYLYIDLRRLEGKALYNAGFFYRLIQFSAGKSQGLSK
ncbi:MAG: hypothetical protein ACOX86_07845 [Pelotomaculaceae bacterium]|jgi:hypothetical protein